MDYELVGQKLRMLRRERNRTQQELAERCEVTKSFLSKIENGKAMPSLGTLSKLAAELGVPLSDLVSEGTTDTRWQHDRAEEVRSGMVHVNQGYQIFPFADHLKNKKIQPFFYEVHKGEISPHHNAHKGEEFFYILEGEMRFLLGEQEHILKQGDGFYFHSSQEHSTVPLTDVVKVLDILI